LLKYNLIIALSSENQALKMVATVGRCYTNPQDYAQENYYSSGEGLVNSEWLGKAATAQGLNGQIQEKDFHNAYKALDPNGNPLRKQQTYSKSSKRHNRPGTDVTLSAPKSISVAALVMGDQQILEAHKNAVRSTMEYVENYCIFYQTKQKGNKLLLPSKTAQIAVFHHDDNRNKDPQLHSHCVILNQTLCPDGTWRAVANKELYIQQKTIGAYYAHELARQLKQIGREIEWTDDHTFELAGVDKEKLDSIFSTRSHQIESELAQRGLTRSTATASQKQAACLKTRPEKKHHHLPQDRERQLKEWQQKAVEAGIGIPFNYRSRLKKAYNQPNHPDRTFSLIQSATDILTERITAFTKHEFLKECLRQSQGKYDPKQIQVEIDSVSDLVPTRDGRLTTTHQLRREQKILQLAEGGRDSFSSLASRARATAHARAKNLNSGQTNALLHMAKCRDAIVLVQGNAGVGKTYTMRALKETLGEVSIRGLAPSAAAALVLQNESDISSQTLASYLLASNERLPQEEILLVDEAGMLSTSQMEQLLEKAQATKSRVILVGDTKQLSAVEAGAPFKLLQDQGLPTAIIDQNLRSRDPFLKQVVERMATHDKDEESVNCAYQKLNNQGKIKQIANEKERIDAIALDYLSRPPEVSSKTLILAGTNADKQAITTAVRFGLIASGTLGNENLQIQSLRRKDLDKFAMTQSHHYQRGDVIKFPTENAQFSKDFYYRVCAVNPKNNTLTLIDTAGVDYTLALDKYKQREVYQVQQLEIRPGEQMRFTKNLRSSDYQQLNGQRFTVEGFTPDGQITILTNGKTLDVSPSQLLHSDYRYVDTVHSSQGQTADYCIYSTSPAKSLTIGRESFYVAASRAREEFVVYTASASDLGLTSQQSRANENALDLVNSSSSRADNIRSTSSKAEAERRDFSDTNREAEDLRNSPTELNRAAENLTGEFQRLSERIRSSDRKNRKARESAKSKLGEIAAQFVEKIQQFAPSLFGDSEDIEQRQVQGTELDRGSNDNQASGISQEHLADSNRYEPSNLGTQPNISSQQQPTSRDQRQGQQQRNSSKSNREEARTVEPTPLLHPQAHPQPTPRLNPLNRDEVMKILRTATEAVERYGKSSGDEKTFNNPYYQIQKKAVFETYGWRHYLTVTATDGRGQILILKGQNSNPNHMDVLKNRLAEQEIKTFSDIQTALDYYQQIRQFKQDAQTILWRLGERDPQNPLSGYGMFEGQKYRIERDEQAFRIIANDGRGEILNYPNDPYARYPEVQASVNFTNEDVDLFRAAVSQIEQQQREAERQRLRQREQERQQNQRGLER
jgi:conjugative relaxase-like TrwC/TraI family protein